jgi:hypothetical protein
MLASSIRQVSRQRRNGAHGGRAGSMVLDLLAGLAAKRFADTIGQKGAERLIDNTRWLFQRQQTGMNPMPSADRLETSFHHHLAEASQWASRIQIEGMSRPRSIASETLPLTLTDRPRRFRRSHRMTRERHAGEKRIPPFVPRTFGDLRPFGEEQLLVEDDNFVLLGAPGAGKTTMLRRLVKQLFTFDENQPDHGYLSVPMVIVLREQASPTSLPEMVLRQLRLHADVRQILDPVETYEARRLQAERQLRDVNEELAARERDIAAAILDTCEVVLFLDGLDEVAPEFRPCLERSIDLLARRCHRSKIIVSCRSGDYGGTFEGFTTVEICALEPAQVERISRLWLGDDADEFLTKIKGSSRSAHWAEPSPPWDSSTHEADAHRSTAREQQSAASELANRPLFLGQMLTVYENIGTIPDQPSALCRQMVRLVLQDWDRQNQAKRVSRYADFQSDAKMDFLYHFAFIVSFNIRKQRFDHQDLVCAYQEICGRFNLPRHQGDEVAREIETHTGIVAQVSYDGFEFSHLSIQEYLAGEYLARLQSDFRHYFSTNPALVAVGVALSSDPGRTLLRLLTEIDPTASSMLSFVTRLVQERPRFLPTTSLARAAIRLIQLAAEHRYIENPVRVLLRDPSVMGSFVEFLIANYDISVRPNGSLSAVLKQNRTPVDAGVPGVFGLNSVTAGPIVRELELRGQTLKTLDAV